MLSEKGLMGELRLALAERLLRGELTHHLAVEARVSQAAGAAWDTTGRVDQAQ